MSRRRRNRRGQDEHQNHDRWLITYADLITLLMIFFIILYAMSKIDLAKFERISLSLSDALPTQSKINLETQDNKQEDKTKEADYTTPEGAGAGGASTGADGGGTVGDNPPQAVVQKPPPRNAAEERAQLDDVMSKVQQYIQEKQLTGKVDVTDMERGIQVTLVDKTLFRSGDAELKPEARDILNSLAALFKSITHEVEIEGHTDDVPITSSKFQSNWELSAQRAINVVHYLERVGLPAERMHAVGYAHTQPLYPNDSDAHRSSNRRVNVILMRNYLPMKQETVESLPNNVQN